LEKDSLKADGTKMEYTEYLIQVMCSRFTGRETLLNVLLNFILFMRAWKCKIANSYNCQHVTYFPKAAPQIVALGLLNRW